MIEFIDHVEISRSSF